jgi:predicted  nucleic acid-binding Zn-ribbon protein
MAEADARARTLMEDIAAMRAAVEPLEERMEQLEREMRAMHESLRKGMSATERGMKETAKLQDVTNERIGGLAEDVKPLGSGITEVEQNTAPLGEQITALRGLMASMLKELTSMRQSIEPVASAAEPVARLRERLPGRG